ncbi:MAG: methylated-DNA--[Eubacteriaceae bacterium]|nr:methylated-DNA--[protein]-cysteine S-methyltransferase [Eubacteriaceae bacterium]
MDEMRYVQYLETPAGLLMLTSTDSVLIGVKWVEDKIKKETESRPILEQTKSQLNEYFEGHRKTFNLSLEARGTAFQKRVWRVIRQIPYGQLRSYQDIANAIDSPSAPRAVGRANNKNPLAVIIPCHRVIGTNGLLTGYVGGLDIKKDLIDLEKMRIIEENNFL